jgi:hypothetical protein
MKQSKNVKCDHCGTKNPETFEGGRLTKCCAVTERDQGCYGVIDNDGKQYYAKEKTWTN